MTEELMVPFTHLKLFFLKILAGMSFFCMIRQKTAVNPLNKLTLMENLLKML